MKPTVVPMFHSPHATTWTPASPKLALAGDKHYVMEGIRSVLVGWGHDVAESFRSIAATRDGLCESEAGILILCFTDGEAALNIFRTLRRICDSRPVILLLQPGDRKTILEAVRLNANGVASTEAPPGTLLQCLETVIAGGAWIDPNLLRHALLTRNAAPADSKPAGTARLGRSEALTVRQKQILELARRGHSDAEIAEKLVIARKTVAMHVVRICQRLCLAGRNELRSYRSGAEQFAEDMSKASELSGREKEVLKLVVDGRGTAEIGAALGVAEGTVRTFLRRIHLKTGTRDRSELIALYSESIAGSPGNDRHHTRHVPRALPVAATC